MSTEHFPAPEVPDLYISASLLDKALLQNVHSLVINRRGLAETCRLATGGEEIKNLGAITLLGHLEPYRNIVKSPPRCFSVCPDQSLQDTRRQEAVGYDELRAHARKQASTLLPIGNHRLTETRLALGLYTAANRWTTNYDTLVSSKNDRWNGGTFGAVAGLTTDILHMPTGLPSIGEYTTPFVGGFLGGLVLGANILAPLISYKRRLQAVSYLRDNPPIWVSYNKYA